MDRESCLKHGLVDALGGISKAVAIAKEKAGIAADQQVRSYALRTKTNVQTESLLEPFMIPFSSVSVHSILIVWYIPDF